MHDFLDELDLDDDTEDEDPEDEERESETKEDINEKQYLWEQLVSADPRLFGYKQRGYLSYASHCGKVDERQPIVWRHSEKKTQDERNPTGYGDVVAIGTHPSSMLYFACPDVWCPRSKHAMTHAQYEVDKGCPGGERPMFFESPYWDGRARKRHIGFLDPSKHPHGLCMPCCYKLPKQRFGACYNEDEDGAPLAYLKNAPYALAAGRLGLLPAAIHALLRNRGRCGPRNDDSGTLTEASDCLVRMGLRKEHRPSFWQLLRTLDPDLRDTSLSALRHRAADALTPHQFCTMKRGAVFRRYVERIDPARIPATHDKRDAVIQAALDAFRDALRLQQESNHFVLQDVAAMVLDVYCIVLDVVDDGDKQSVRVHCPSLPVPPVYFAAVCSNRFSGYELVVRARATGVAKNVVVDARLDASESRLASIHGACGADPSLRALRGLDDTLSAVNARVTGVVLSTADMLVCGVLLDDGVYLPLPTRIPCFADDQRAWRWLFLEDVLASDAVLRITRVQELLAFLRQQTGDARFRVTHRLLDEERFVVALQMGDSVVPINTPRLRASHHALAFLHGMHELTQPAPADPRIAAAIRDVTEEQHVTRKVAAVFHAISRDQDAALELRFLRSAFNPFPTDARATHARRFVQQFVETRGGAGRTHDKFYEMAVAAVFAGVAAPARKPLYARADEALLTSMDVQEMRGAGDLTPENLAQYVMLRHPRLPP